MMVFLGTFLEISPGRYNKLNSYNSTKDSLYGTQEQLRGPQITCVMVGGRGSAVMWPQATGSRLEHAAVWSLLQSRDREEFGLQVYPYCLKSGLENQRKKELKPMLAAEILEQD